jgi:hypothetical protein
VQPPGSGCLMAADYECPRNGVALIMNIDK